MKKICRNGHEYVPERGSTGKWKTCIKCMDERYHREKIKNPGLGSQKTIAWQRANPDKYNTKQRKWCKDNPGKMNAKTAKRHAAKMERTPKWLNEQQLKEIQEFYIKASETGLTVDHIIPLQGKNVSGLHVPWNLQLLPASLNYSKGNRI